MRQLYLIIGLTLIQVANGQTIKAGLYKGVNLFETCYLIYNDSTIEVEYFYIKAGQVFGHFPAKKLLLTSESSILKSSDDSIRVFNKGDRLIIKRKGYHKAKVRLTKDNISTLLALRQNHQEFISR